MLALYSLYGAVALQFPGGIKHALYPWSCHAWSVSVVFSCERERSGWQTRQRRSSR